MNSSKNNGANDNHSNNTRDKIKIPLSSWRVVIILSCISGMVVYAETMLIPAIPNIIKDLHFQYDDSAWIITIFLISGAVMTPLAGQLSDRYGKKKILIIMMIIYVIGVLMGRFADN